ncbi:integrase catalytic domain-containing protein [Trichonephila clavipes]|nr:integrase catalytic domain-containing protein [Trichonephila clavipes]
MFCERGKGEFQKILMMLQVRDPWKTDVLLCHEVESEEMICLACAGFGKDRVGHLAKRCHSRVRCLICKRRHYPLLCPDLHKEKETNFSTKARTTDNEQKSTETLLTNLPSEHEIYLETYDQTTK